jgi:hypothetical protein
MNWLRGHKYDFDEAKIFQHRRKLGLGAGINGGFLRAVQRNLLKDVASYSILKNPTYKNKFAISWNFAAKHRRVSEVRLSIGHSQDGPREGTEDAVSALNNDDPIQAEEMRRRRESWESDHDRSERVSEHSSHEHSSRRQSRNISPSQSPERNSGRSTNPWTSQRQSRESSPGRQSVRFEIPQLSDMPSIRNMYNLAPSFPADEVFAERVAQEMVASKKSTRSSYNGRLAGASDDKQSRSSTPTAKRRSSAPRVMFAEDDLESGL